MDFKFALVVMHISLDKIISSSDGNQINKMECLPKIKQQTNKTKSAHHCTKHVTSTVQNEDINNEIYCLGECHK